MNDTNEPKFAGLCTTKNVYKSEYTARNAADAMNRYSRYGRVTPYRCPLCGRWHVRKYPQED